MTRFDPTPPEIDYLAKDFASFRRLMLDQLTLRVPDWRERNPSDLAVTIVEVLAYVADQLSYYQDAVATEAYLGTARRFESVRRHVRMLDYRLHAGCNARAWVQLQVRDGDDLTLPAGSQLLSRWQTSAIPAVIDFGSARHQEALARRTPVFETMHAVLLRSERNEMRFDYDRDLPKRLEVGATTARLVENGRPLELHPGDVVILEEVRSPSTGQTRDADPKRRHVVRLTEVRRAPGDARRRAAVEVRWAAADALPFSLQVAPLSEASPATPVSVARGNVVLADQGRTMASEPLPDVQAGLRYKPYLRHPSITHCEPYRHEQAARLPAARVHDRDPRLALAAVALRQPLGGTEFVWRVRPDLLSSDGIDRHFVVESTGDERSFLRFGFGGVGVTPQPGDRFLATYRVGNGVEGNVGAQAIAHLLVKRTVDLDERLAAAIVAIGNPMPARGGLEREELVHARMAAPQAFRTPLRCVTAEDYADRARRHPAIAQAIARLKGAHGGGTLVELHVRRRDGAAVDAALRDELIEYLEPYRVIGHEIEIRPPRYVSVDVALSVGVRSTHAVDTVRKAAADALGVFFQPANFAFGQPLYRSPLIAAAMSAPGVAWVDLVRFRRQGAAADVETITTSPLEIIRLENNPARPLHGRLEWTFEVES